MRDIKKTSKSCNKCNRALGGFYDSKKNLKNAISYLEKHEENQ